MAVTQRAVLHGANGSRKAILYPGFVEELFSGGTTLTLSHTIDADTFIDIWIDGGLQDLAAWSRNVGANTVTLSETVPAGRSVRVRIYPH